jgi:DNA-3-methyladenine glycosylase I
MEKKRCQWSGDSKIYQNYHDQEWGVPQHDDRELFELLILEGAQAGLSWLTVLKKRKNYKQAFDNFDAKKIANYNDKKITELLNNPGIIRNKLKINSTIRNAKIFLKIQQEYGSFDKYIWSFTNQKPITNNFNSISELPAKTDLSDKISKDLKQKGMNFVGSTIIYAYLQAIGIVNDHEVGCFRHKEIKNNQK